MKPKIIIIVCLAVFLATGLFFAHNRFGIARNDLLKIQLSLFPDNPALLVKMAAALQEEEGFRRDLDEYRKILRLQAEGRGEGLDLNNPAIARVQKVLKLYKKAISLDPKNLQAHYRLGQISDFLGLVPIAFSQYLEAVNIDPYFIDGHYSLAALYGQVGDYAQAAKAFSQILTLLKDDETAYIRVVDMLSGMLEGAPDNSILRHSRREVVEKFTELVNRSPKTADLYYNLGVVLARIGETERAVSAYRSALDLNSRHVKAMNNLGNMLLGRGQAAEAERFFARALEINPDLTAARMNMGVIQAKRGNLKSAKEIYEDVIRRDPENSEAHFMLGYIREASGELRGAIEAYARAMEFDRGNAGIYFNSGNVHVQLGMGEKALELYRKTLEVNPNHMDGAVNGCLVSAETGKWEQAKRFCSEAQILGYAVPKEIADKL